MKKYTSILMLLAGSTALPLVGLLVILAVAEGGLFYLHNDPSFPLDSVFQSSRLGIAAAVVLFLWMAALLIPRFSRGSMTLARLQVNHSTIYLLHALYNALTLVILWGFQVLLIIGFAWYYGRTADPSIFGLQSTVLTFYRVPFLHGLLPMADWAPWVRNIACILALGFAAAYPATDEGQRRNALALAGSLTVVAAWTFPAAMDSRMVIAGVIGSIAAAVTYAVQEPTYGGGGEA